MQNYWKFIKTKAFYKEDKVLILNSTKSNYFHFYRQLSLSFSNKNQYKTNQLVPQTSNHLLLHQVNPFQILEFPFHKKTYDTFIFFIIFLITYNYISFKNDFSLKYSFIIKPSNFDSLIFLNKFYFQTFNY